MATSTELLRAAEHMRQQSDAALKEANGVACGRNAAVRGSSYSKAADALEAEAARLRFDEDAKRLQAVEAQQPKPAAPYCSDAVGRYEGTRVLVEETPSAYAVRLKDNQDNSLHVGKRCDGPLEPHRFLLALCKEVVRPLASRSWPEGWPPFAVLRRAYEQIQVEPTPSTLWCERHGLPSTRWVASEVRKEFAYNVSALAAQRPA